MFDIFIFSIYPKIRLTLSAHVRCGHPHVHHATVFVQVHHGLRGHVFRRVASAAVGVVHHVRLCLEVHHCSNAQFVLHLDCHMFDLSRAAAEPDSWEHPAGQYIWDALITCVIVVWVNNIRLYKIMMALEFKSKHLKRAASHSQQSTNVLNIYRLQPNSFCCQMRNSIIYV